MINQYPHHEAAKVILRAASFPVTNLSNPYAAHGFHDFIGSLTQLSFCKLPKLYLIDDGSIKSLAF